ncbi:MAG: dienelactone hydrolase family protein [Actinomycetota bacterium]
MCYGPDSRPPIRPISGGSYPGREHVLRSADGTEFLAFSAAAKNPGGAGIVILPDIRGLHTFYEDLATRFAEAGVHATAIDYFGRTAGTEPRTDDFDFMTHVPQTRADQVVADIRAAVDHLRSDEGGEATAVFTVGFCFGGRISFNQSGEDHDVAGVIGFYGRLGEKRFPGDSDAPATLAARSRCPVLGLFGGNDQGIPAEEIEGFQKALEAAGVVHEIHVYDGAPHSFFDRLYEKFETESEDAWRRILDFIRRYS